MSQTDKAKDRFDLTCTLGMILGSIDKLSREQPPPPPFTYYQLAEQLREDINHWNPKVDEFARLPNGGILGIAHQIKRPLETLRTAVFRQARREDGTDLERQSEIAAALIDCKSAIEKQLSIVPLNWDSTMYAGQSQLTIYCKMREALATAHASVHYFDRYLQRDFFHLYLRDLPRNIQVRLCTTAGVPKYDYGVCSVKLISKRAAAEFPDFELREATPEQLHDRNLRIDGQVFHLGTSVKSAGLSPMNWSIGDNSAIGQTLLDTILANSTLVTY